MTAPTMVIQLSPEAMALGLELVARLSALLERAAPPPALAPPATRTNGQWTPERDVMLRREFPTRRPRADILAAINALPGAPISSPNAMSVRAHRMGLRSQDTRGRRSRAALARTPS